MSFLFKCLLRRFHEDLKRAIEMSLQDTKPSSPPAIVLDDSDDDDEDMRRAIALSLQDAKGNVNNSSTSEAVKGTQNGQYGSQSSNSAPPTQPASASSNRPPTQSLQVGLLGIDRKAMEQERLARLGKRTRTASPDYRPNKFRRPPNRRAGHEEEEEEDTLADMRFPLGVVKRTWAHKYPRTNDIKLEEVFDPAPKTAILSALHWNDEWVFSKLPPQKTKQIWVMSAKGEELQNKLLGEATEARIPNFRPHFPPMDGNVQHMHSKLMLLFHDDFLRIVVPSANMIKEEWGETNTKDGVSWQPAVLENTAFLIDLPRRQDGTVGAVGQKEDLTAFGQSLIEFLEAMGMRKNAVDGVLKFDFSLTKDFGFVHAIPGTLTSQYADHTGLEGLRTAVQKLGLDDVETMELDYASASLGALKESFLKSLYAAACGRPVSAISDDFLDHFRIYFPTDETVKKSNGGPDCGGIITLNRSYYNNASFPKKCMRNHMSTRQGLLSHNKLLLARGHKKDGTPVAWAYVGSANLSESAWGSQRELKSGKLGKMAVRNWECGVVVPVPEAILQALALKDGEVPPIWVFKDVLEVPFHIPGEPYGDKQPWFFRDFQETAPKE
ncbi:phospholipase D/nuclease [Sporormia fimetaria CBS 119925]|uniref:Phospholipase D/nuclease n=1 Tax=Sporormia fimetaria CBS 119925 TaxID=1340428 RepID=A0A6A6V248_9PLEO|nr:phospholipase D/nuclease [Sporormia fimetaria CBS 119925]